MILGLSKYFQLITNHAHCILQACADKLRELKNFEKKLVPLLKEKAITDLSVLIKEYIKNVTLTDQTIKNLRYYNTAPPGTAITGQYINNTLGQAAQLCLDAGKELAGAGFTLREVKKKLGM